MTPATQRRSLALPVTGMRCAGCAQSVERLLLAAPGVRAAVVNFATRRAEVTLDGDLGGVQRALEDGGFGFGTRRTLCSGEMDAAALGAVAGVLEVKPVPSGIEVLHLDAPEVLEALREQAGEAAQLEQARARDEDLAQDEAREARRRVWLGAGPTLALVLVSMEPGRSLVPAAWGSAPVQAILALFVLVAAGSPILRAALAGLRHRRADMNTLVALGALSAFGLSLWRTLLPPAGQVHVYFETSAVIIELVLLGRWLEARARRRMGDALAALERRAPESALLLTQEGDVRRVHPSRLLPDDRVRVLPGQAFPADGVVVSGNSSADEALLTGESLPVAKVAGDAVLAGTVNGLGAVEVCVRAAGSGTLLATIARQVAAAQGSRAPIARLADRVAAVFVPTVLLTAVLTLLGWWLLQGHAGLGPGLSASISVLLIACPCALGLATPTALVVGLGRAARHGILVRDAQTLERAAGIRVVCLDKTGTLTKGRPQVLEVLPLSGTAADVLQLAGAVEQGSEHPLATAVVQTAQAEGLRLAAARNARAAPGLGVSADVGEERVHVGSPGHLEQAGVSLAPFAQALAKADARGATVLLVATSERAIGALLVRDEPRPEARDVVRRLRASGREVVLLSGDRAAAAQAIARELEIQQWHAPLSPLEKAEWLRANATRHCAMVGDGVNDAPALAAAGLGISVQGATDVALGAAGMALVEGDLRRVADALELARRTLRTIRQNLFWAFAYNVLGIPVAALGLLHPMLAAGAMAGSSLFVVGNSLRLARVALGPESAR